MQNFTQTLRIEQQHAASALGSGFLDVFATPAMVALMENTASKTITDLEQGYTTVGIEINVKHLKASAIGEVVTCEATLIRQEKRLYEFEITVTDASGETVGTGTHKRVAVDIERFMNKI